MNTTRRPPTRKAKTHEYEANVNSRGPQSLIISVPKATFLRKGHTKRKNNQTSIVKSCPHFRPQVFLQRSFFLLALKLFKPHMLLRPLLDIHAQKSVTTKRETAIKQFSTTPWEQWPRVNSKCTHSHMHTYTPRRSHSHPPTLTYIYHPGGSIGQKV